MLSISESLKNLRGQVEELKLQVHMIRIAPMDMREKNFSSVLRQCRKQIAVLKREIMSLLKGVRK